MLHKGFYAEIVKNFDSHTLWASQSPLLFHINLAQDQFFRLGSRQKMLTVNPLT